MTAGALACPAGTQRDVASDSDVGWGEVEQTEGCARRDGVLDGPAIGRAPWDPPMLDPADACPDEPAPNPEDRDGCPDLKAHPVPAGRATHGHASGNR